MARGSLAKKLMDRALVAEGLRRLAVERKFGIKISLI